MSNAPKTRLLNVRDYTTIDTETTGLSPVACDVIEIAAVKVRNGVPVDRFQSLIKPSYLSLDPFIENLTGITSDMLQDAPLKEDVSKPMLEFIGDDPILGHNVSFDVAFIEQMTDKSLGNVLFDTRRIGLHVFPSSRQTLGATVEECKKAGADFDSGDYHRAMYDAECTLRCYEWMRPKLIEKYGDDPENGYRKIANSRKPSKPRPGGFFATVDEIDESTPFFGTTIAFTGKLNSMTREEAMQAAVNMGAEPKNTVSKKLDYLVLGSFDFVAALKGKKSSKLVKAEELAQSGCPLRVIDEDFFANFIPAD